MGGDDQRILRYDTTKHTDQRQREGGCAMLKNVSAVIPSDQASLEAKGLACEYLTYCITDNPAMRVQFADLGVHDATVELLEAEKSHTSAMASHLIYISSFANPTNHKTFAKLAVRPLSRVVVKGSSDLKSVSRHQVMWALAALQNLAASYCDTVNDGRCYWEWNSEETVLSIDNDSLPMVSDGTDVRQAIATDEVLLEAVTLLACTGPVSGPMSTSNPFPGQNARLNEHNDSPNIVAWAAAAVLKNLALEEDARPIIERTDVVPCLCRLAKSKDWLEQEKATFAIEHLRPNSPCWYRDDRLCVDKVYTDPDGKTCADYRNVNNTECESVDEKGLTARKACCVCTGGDIHDGGRDEL